MWWKNTPEDEATRNALGGALALVLIPGAIFVFALIYLVSPKQVPAPQSWANGTYRNACCPPLTLLDGKISGGNVTATYIVSEGKFGRQIEVARGIGVRNRRVEFGGTYVYVFFNKNSMALPAKGAAESLHLIGLEDDRAYIFVKR